MTEAWQAMRLEDICEFKGGGTPSKAVDRYWQGDIPWVSPKDMKSQVVLDSIDHITSEAVAASATSMIEPGSILIVVRSGILARTVPVAIAGRALAMNQDLKALCPRPSIDSWFLYYLLEAKMAVLLALVSRGATVHRLITDQIRAVELMLPPLPQQRRIVAILDEAFDGIATAKTNTEKNLQNARDLFEGHIEAVFAQRGDGWLDAPIVECFKVRSGDFLPAKSMASEGDVPVYGGNGIAGSHDVWNLSGDQIVIGRVGAKCGNVRHVSGELWLTDNAFHISKYLRPFAPAFLARVLNLKNLRQTANQAAQPVISYTTIKDVVLSFPVDIEEQRGIAARLDGLEEQIKRVEAVYEGKLTALVELKKSLLHQAFTGALTAKATDKQLEAVG